MVVGSFFLIFFKFLECAKNEQRPIASMLDHVKLLICIYLNPYTDGISHK